MKNRDIYEIDIRGIFAVLLTKWKKITVIALLGGFVGLGIAALGFGTAQMDVLDHYQLSDLIADRKEEEVNLFLSQKRFDENLLYKMDPSEILTKKMTVTVILEDQNLIHDQVDPADLVLYAYWDLAMSQLQEEVLVPEVLTKQQQEQLMTIELDANKNVLIISMTADDEALADAVLKATESWYSEVEDSIALQTFAHRLEVLTVTTTAYTYEERALLVNSAAAESEIRSLELKIAEQNQIIENLLKKKEGWATSQSVEDLERILETKWQKDSAPRIVTGVLGCGSLGIVFAVLLICVPIVAKGRLLGDKGIQFATGWTYIGRCFNIRKTKDPVVLKGLHILYQNVGADKNYLSHEVREMTEMLLEDRRMDAAETVVLIGNIPEAKWMDIVAAVQGKYQHIKTAHLSADRVSANRLCREAGGVIFVGTADQVTMGDVEALEEILLPLEKKPLGYILVQQKKDTAIG